MNCEIEEGTCVILCDYIEDDVMMTLIALMELLNLESLEDLIRLFIFRLLSTTNPYYERFPVEMEVLLDPLYQDLDSYITLKPVNASEADGDLCCCYNIGDTHD